VTRICCSTVEENAISMAGNQQRKKVRCLEEIKLPAVLAGRLPTRQVSPSNIIIIVSNDLYHGGKLRQFRQIYCQHGVVTTLSQTLLESCRPGLYPAKHDVTNSKTLQMVQCSLKTYGKENSNPTNSNKPNRIRIQGYHQLYVSAIGEKQSIVLVLGTLQKTLWNGNHKVRA
jgi:hypothetical protein